MTKENAKLAASSLAMLGPVERETMLASMSGADRHKFIKYLDEMLKEIEKNPHQ